MFSGGGEKEGAFPSEKITGKEKSVQRGMRGVRCLKH